MSKYLYLDTSSDSSLVMLCEQAAVLAWRSNAIQKDHASLINLHIAEVLNESATSWSDVNGIVVLNGPGSYTGLRIALATAKGLCYARKLPLYLINKLDMILFATSKESRGDLNGIALKAREGEYFWAVYNKSGEVVVAPSLSTKEEVLEYFKHNTCSLFFMDEQISSEIALGSVVSIQSDRIAQFIETHIIDSKPADLFLSEPFYLKNVHINKINKL